MRPPDHDGRSLDPAEEASFRRVMARLRARLSQSARTNREPGPVSSHQISRLHAAICGVIEIE